MAVQQGYGKMAGTDALVFAYDTGDAVNSYKGEPTVNLANTDSKRTLANYGGGTTSYADAPEKGPGWKKVTITAINGSNFRLAKFPYITQPTNATRTYSLEIDFNGTSGYWFRGDGFSGLGPNIYSSGIHSWTFTTTTNSGSMALFLNNGRAAVTGLNDVIYYRYYQVEDNAHRTSFTEGTRSATEGLLDLTGNRQANLNNTGFNSNAEIEFDGTDDNIYIGRNLGFQNASFSLEALIYWDGNSTDTFFGYGDSLGTQRSIHWRIYDTGLVRFDFFANSINSGLNAIQPNTWYTLTVTYDHTNNRCTCYRNGEVLMSGTIGPYLGDDSISDGYIGAWTPSSQPFGGKVDIFKIYNRSLSASEVKSNYANYRGRRQDLSNYYDHTSDGGGWIRWWWYTGVGWPGHETEALGHPFGTFDSSSHYGFQRLPEGLDKEQVELLAKDGDGNIYKWDFASPSATAQQVWDSFTLGTQGVWNNTGDAWNPEVIAGSFFGVDQDAWQYRVSEGVASFMLDDDTCDCYSTLNAGHAMCGGSGWNQDYAQPDGAYLRYGVDTLNDGGCRGPLPERTLELFYRLK